MNEFHEQIKKCQFLEHAIPIRLQPKELRYLIIRL